MFILLFGYTLDSFKRYNNYLMAIFQKWVLRKSAVVNIERNRCRARHLTQNGVDFMRVEFADFDFDIVFIQCLQGEKKLKIFLDESAPE